MKKKNRPSPTGRIVSTKAEAMNELSQGLRLKRKSKPKGSAGAS